jgi:hypothetical protein
MAVVFQEFVRSRWASAACLAVVLLALALPARGLVFPGGRELPLCQFKRVTHLPCPGCGLTRSFIGMAHLDLPRAARFHPLGLVLFPLVLFLAALLPAPAAARERVAAWAERNRGLVTWALWGLMVVFFAYGWGRMMWVLAVPSRGNIW